MKPCLRNRKQIACLMLGTIEAKKAAALREHFAVCDGCRSYWEEIANVSRELEAAAPNARLEASDFFHHRVAERLRSVESRSFRENLAARLVRWPLLGWRAALPAVVVLGFAVLAIVALRNPVEHLLSTTPSAQVLSGSGSKSELAPSIGNYQMVAGQSLEKLSELLTEQGNRILPPAPAYSELSFGPSTGAF